MNCCTAVDEALCRVQLESSFVEKLLPQLMDLVRYSRLLPQGEEHAIRRGSRDFLASSKDLGQRSLAAALRIFQYLDETTHRGTKPEDLKNFNLMVDSLDDVLERVDANLRDAASGVRDREAREDPEEEAPAPGPAPGSRLPKPQVRWRHLVDNHRTRFVPRLLVKHNEQSPLSTKLLEAQQKVGIRPNAEPTLPGVGGSQDLASALAHPYEQELSAISWPDSFFEPRPAQRYPRVEDTPLVIVRSESQLREMIEEIKATCTGKEIAVDVEHHDQRSYRGFVCLIQVSTRNKDFLVDPFDIFEQMHLLNEIFSDPRILKVLHGADRDVMWLQRDFSVYLVNMFDTGLATRQLRLQGGYSLANLVSQFCGVKLDKKYQTADWRERPLPTDMIYYARADTHYLLFCFDCLKNALLAQSGMASTSGVNLGIPTLERGDVQATDEGVQALQTVMQQSAALCAQAYREAPLDAGELAQGLCKRFGSKQPLETKQLNTLKALAEWRDQLARNMDESSNHVAPDSCLWRICLAMPTSPVKLRSTCNPLPAILQQHAQEVVDIVVKCSQGQTPLELTAREPARPEPRVEEPAVEEEAQELVMKQDWPTRSPEASPRPLVHITATFAGTREVQCKRKWSVLCGFDSASEEPRDSEQSRPQKRARVIRRKLSFGVSAPAVVTAAVPDSASAVLQATVRDLSSASQAEAPSQEGPSDPQAEPGEPGELGELGEGQGEPEMPVPLRKRKRKRRATASLEQLVAAPAAKAATPVAMTSAWPDCGQFHLQKAAKAAASPVKPAAKATTPVAKTSVEPVSQAAKAAASPVKPAAKATTPAEPKKKRRKVLKRVQAPVVDPYL